MLHFESETGRFYMIVDGSKVYANTVWEEQR